jgi:hypothetical protein
MDGAKWLRVAAVCLLLAGWGDSGFGESGADPASSPTAIGSGGTTPVNSTGQHGMQESQGIHGRVVALSGAPVAGAEVARRPIDPQRPITLQAAVTDAEGRYEWMLKPGVWEIVISAAGYLPARQRVSVTERRWETLNFVLEPS